MKLIPVRNQLACVVFILILLAHKVPAASVVVNSSPDIGGSASGSGTYPVGKTVALTAIPTNACWAFTNWSDGSMANPRSITVVADTNYTAIFIEKFFSVRTGVAPTNGGITTGDTTTNCGASMTVTATANPCFTFTHWSDGSTNNPRTITVLSDTNLTAKFVAAGNWTVTTAWAPAGGGTTTGDTTTNCGAPVLLTAIPDTCWRFTNWSDGNTDNPRTITVLSDTNLTATFVPIVSVNVTTAWSPIGGGTTAGDTTTNCGAAVTLTAIPTNACWAFTKWSDGSTDNPYTITVSSDTNLTANFVKKSFSIQTMVAPLNSGTTAGDTTANCGAVVTVTAIPNAGYNFLNWTTNKMVFNPFTHTFQLVKEVVSTLPHYMFTVGGNQTLTANFLKPCQFSISPTESDVIPVTGGGGSVGVSTSAGCDWTYSNPYPWVQITNVTASGLKFWVKPAPVSYVPGTAATVVSYHVVPFTLQIAGEPFTVRQTVKVIAHSPILTNMPAQ